MSAPVLTRTQILDHPQVQANDLPVNYEHPQAGQVRQTRGPSRFSGSPDQDMQGAPALGRHTRSLLVDCGYSEDEIQKLIDSGKAGG